MGLLNKFLHFLIPDSYFESSNKEANDQTIDVCPKCLLPDLQYVNEITSGWATPARKYCPHCGYSGLLTFEISLQEYNSIPPEERMKWLREMQLKTFAGIDDEYPEFESNEETDDK